MIMLILLIFREMKGRPAHGYISNYSPSLNSELLFMLMLVIIFSLLRKWFTISEVIAMNMALVPAI